MLEDLVPCKGKLVDKLKCDKEVVSRKRPKCCPNCFSKSIIGVEVMGAYDGTLLWECDDCEHTILRFKEDKTEKYLQSAKGFWTNPEDWGFVPRSEFN